MPHDVVFEARARADINAIADWVADAAGPDVAIGYVTRLRDKYLSLRHFPMRGTPRPGTSELRTIPFERRATILYGVEDGLVRIWGVFHAGRSIELD